MEFVTERHLINLSKREADISMSFVPPMGPRLDVRKAGVFKLGLYSSEAYLQKRGKPESVDDLQRHDFVDYVSDLMMIDKVHWLLDVIEPEHVVFRSSSMAAQQNSLAAGRGIGLLPFFRRRPINDWFASFRRLSVERELFIAVHEDIQFMGRIRAVTKFLFALFEKQAAYLNKG